MCYHRRKERDYTNCISTSLSLYFINSISPANYESLHYFLHSYGSYTHPEIIRLRIKDNFCIVSRPNNLQYFLKTLEKELNTISAVLHWLLVSITYIMTKQYLISMQWFHPSLLKVYRFLKYLNINSSASHRFVEILMQD